MLHRSRSHWFHSAEPYAPSAPLEGVLNVDVCVVGGGVTGLSTAYHLKKLDQHASVALLESEVVGFGASGRNAGQLIVAFGESDFKAQMRRHGAGKLREAYTYIHEGISTIEDLINEHDIACDYEQTGYFEMGLRADGSETLDEYLAFCRGIGQDSFLEPISEAQVARSFQSPYFGKAVFDRRGGQFNPLKYLRELKFVVQRFGVQVHENSPVACIEREPSCISLRTGRGTLRCQKLVVATNAYSHLLPGLEDLGMIRSQSPVFVYANVTEPLSKSQWGALNWPRRAGVNLMSKLFYSFAPTRDGRLLYVGGYYARVPQGNEMSLDISKDFLTEGPRHLASFFPALSDLRTVQSWGGPISTTRDFIPHVGLLADDRIGYANGCWGHGMPLGTSNGRTLAGLMLNRRTTDSASWLVTRNKIDWPSRMIVSPVVRSLSSAMRRDIRKIGRKMQPRLVFEK